MYAASKTQAEQACWKFMKEEKPNYVLNCICPNFNVGNILHPSQPASTAGAVRGMWEGKEQAIGMVRTFGGQFMIDVGDDAKLHLAGLIYEDVQNERLLGFAEPVNFNRFVEGMRNIEPSRKLPDLIEGEGKDLSKPETSRSIELLKRFGQDGWTDFQSSLKRNVGQ